MRILHACLSNWYVDDFSYQENELVRQHLSANHQVYVVASTETISKSGDIRYVKPGSYIGSYGEHITRLPYARFFPHFIMKKLRIHPAFSSLLQSIQPDVILFHGTCGWELLTAASYVSRVSDCMLYVDSHEDFFNSARNFLSRYILHSLYYRLILAKALPFVRKVLCYLA